MKTTKVIGRLSVWDNGHDVELDRSVTNLPEGDYEVYIEFKEQPKPELKKYVGLMAILKKDENLQCQIEYSKSGYWIGGWRYNDEEGLKSSWYIEGEDFPCRWEK